MCYDVSFKTDIKSLEDYFPDLVHDDQFTINFEDSVHILGQNFKEQPIIYRNREDGKLHVKLMEWGVIPFYDKDYDKFHPRRKGFLNATQERILDDTGSYWYQIRNRRCLIPLTSIIEHREVKGISNKVPYAVKLKDEKMLFVPGLYSVVKYVDKDTGEVTIRHTYTQITTSANFAMRQIHNSGDHPYRMPLFVPFDIALEWLSDDLTEERYRQILNYIHPSQMLEFHTIYTVRGPKRKIPRPDGKDRDEFYDWGPKVAPIEMGSP